MYGSKAETDKGPGQGQAKKDASHRKAHYFSHSAVIFETVSSVIRPATLAVRLAANMIAGYDEFLTV